MPSSNINKRPSKIRAVKVVREVGNMTDWLKCLQDAAAAVAEFWLIKIIFASLGAGFIFLFGVPGAPFMALWVLVAVDTASKWLALTVGYAKAKELTCSLPGAFYLAWRDPCGPLNSHSMRYKFTPKIIVYILALIAGHQLGVAIGPKVFMGVNWAEVGEEFVTIYLAFCEIISIFENFALMGWDGAGPIGAYFRRRRDQMLGGNQPCQSISPMPSSPANATGAQDKTTSGRE